MATVENLRKASEMVERLACRATTQTANTTTKPWSMWAKSLTDGHVIEEKDVEARTVQGVSSHLQQRIEISQLLVLLWYF